MPNPKRKVIEGYVYNAFGNKEIEAKKLISEIKSVCESFMKKTPMPYYDKKYRITVQEIYEKTKKI